ncbi:MAG: hypothetical protein ACE5ES_04805 [Candidatus Nanoarchaeia archaeon]
MEKINVIYDFTRKLPEGLIKLAELTGRTLTDEERMEAEKMIDSYVAERTSELIKLRHSAFYDETITQQLRTLGNEGLIEYFEAKRSESDEEIRGRIQN